METIDISRIKYGWRATCEDLHIDAENPHMERGVLRAVLTVRHGTALYHRDTVTLTSSRVRTRLLRLLADKGLMIEERVLLALDEACRTRPTPPAENQNTPGAPDFSENVTQLIDVQSIVTSFLLLNDPDILPVTLGALAAHRLGGTPPWLLIVAPPSSAKTELISALGQVTGTYFLSSLTAQTLASGLDKPGVEPSLLMRLENEILLLKDLTTVLELPHEERQAVLAQLREVYDGRFDKTWGNGKELHWQGRLGFLAGVTPVIDTYYGAMAVLGARFLLFRMEQAGRQETARKALDNAKDEVEQRQKIAQYIAAFMAQLPTVVPTVPEPLYAQLAALTDFVTRCRSGVIRDGYRRELEYAPEPEMPARLAKQLLGLLCGVALVCGHEDATQEDYDRIARVALDCIPAVRRKVLLALATLHDVCGTMDTDAVSTTRVAATAQYSTTAVRRALEDLQALGVLAVEKGGQGKADLWTLLPEWAEAIQTVKKVKTLLDSRRKTAFSEKSGEGGMRNICAETLVGAHPPSPNGTHGTHGTPMDAAEALEEGIL